MTPQERDVIAGIFDRLRQAANQPRDPEAERFIAERLREQPYAPYAMAQSVYVQEQALANLNSQVEALQQQVDDLQQRARQAAPASGGFLSGIFGGGRQPEAPARAGAVPSFPHRAGGQPSGAWSNTAQQGGMGGMPMQAAQGQPGPWGGQPGQQQPIQQQPPARGGGFMAGALQTAAGVAGGVVLGNVLMNAFSGAKPGEAKPAETAANGGGANEAQPASNTDYNDGSSDQANYQNAGYQPPADAGYDDGSSFSGGDDDSWA